MGKFRKSDYGIVAKLYHKGKLIETYETKMDLGEKRQDSFFKVTGGAFTLTGGVVAGHSKNHQWVANSAIGHFFRNIYIPINKYKEKR